MFSPSIYQSLAFSFILGNTLAFNLDVNSQDSIRSVAKNLTGGIVGLYKRGLQAYNVPGLFYDPITVLREPYYWWEAGAVFGGLIEYSHLTGDDQYSELIGTALGWQMGAYDFMPENQTKTLGNDDQSFWGLAAMTAAETGLVAPNDVGEWADLAINVFNTQVERWNTETCGGGLNWQIFSFNNGYSYKNSISTGNFFLLSARLAKFTGNTTYSDWAQKAMDWSQDVGLISDDYAVYDGAQDTSNCSQINRIQWTENSAIFAEGAALMYNLTKGDEKWKSAVAGFVGASSVFQRNDSNILFEVACERTGKCNNDQRAFKGVAIRSWARAAQAAPFVSDAIMKMIKASAPVAAKLCTGEHYEDPDMGYVECPFEWSDSNDGDYGLGETHNALQAVTALLWPQAKALVTNNNSTGGSSAGGSTANETKPGASQNTDAPGAASAFSVSSMALFAATVAAVLFL